MSTLAAEREQARKLGCQINCDARSNLNSPYAGKVVGIPRGEVVIVANTLDEVAEALERLEPDPQRRTTIETDWYLIGRPPETDRCVRSMRYHYAPLTARVHVAHVLPTPA